MYNSPKKWWDALSYPKKILQFISGQSKSLLIGILVFSGSTLFSQTETPELQNLHSLEYDPCGFDQYHNELMQTDPAYYQRTQDFNAFMSTYVSEVKITPSTYKVPVVVHVMGEGTALTSISDAEIREGIKNLNDRYRKVPGSSGDGGGVDMDIEFALAVRDPNGNCTNGIVRYDLTGNATYVSSGVFRSSAGISDATLKAYSVWDQTRYYNIWLVSEIDGNNGGAGIQGYAMFASSHGTALDGAVILCNNWKDPVSVTAAHELGHAFNLYHTFQGDNNGVSCPGDVTCGTDSDCCADIPPHIRFSSHPNYWGLGENCSYADPNACAGGSTTQDHMKNYMDYSHDYCQNEFTADQSARVTAALTTTRASFLESNGNMSLIPPSIAGVDFEASSSFVCSGTTVDFRDISSCIPNTFLDHTSWAGITFSWNITDGGTNTFTSTLQNPSITFTNAGVYDVSLTVSNAYGSASYTKQGMIIVGTSPTAACTPGSANQGNYAQTVSRVSFENINSSTSSITNVAYTDYSCSQNTYVAAGGTYPIEVDLRAGGSGPEIVEVYIDYNNNGSFMDVGELVLSGTTGTTNTTTTVAGNITIPGGATVGTLLRMRVMGETNSLTNNERNCLSNLFIGDVEDYGVYISNNIASVTISASPSATISYGTSVTFTATPVNGGTAPVYSWYVNGVLQAGATTATFSTGSLLDGDEVYCVLTSNLAGVINSPTSSNVIVMHVTGPPISDFVANPVTLCAGNSVSFSDLSKLVPTSWSWTFNGGTPATSALQNPVVTYSAPGTYEVILTASNGYGTGTTETKTAYITVYAVPANICNSFVRTATAGFDIGIHRVQVGTIDNSTAWNDGVYNDYVCEQQTTLAPNTNYAISVTGGAYNNQWLRVYIDYNNDGDFNDAGELIFSPSNGVGAFSGNFTTPSAPVMNELLRMRVISDFVNTTPGSCTNSLQYGQVEDYGIVISNGPTPLPVEFVSFEAKSNDCTNTLEWRIASESNCDSYSIERSYNGFQWEEIAKISAVGNSTELLTYSYRDSEFSKNGLMYYRLNQMDVQGSQAVLKVTALTAFCDWNKQLSIYPNPTNDKITIEGQGIQFERIILVDATGKVIIEHLVQSDAETIDLKNRANGVYTVIAYSKDRVFHGRVIKN